MAKNPITVLAEGNKLLDELAKKLTGVNTHLLEISKSARGSNLKDFFNAQAPSDVTEKLKLQKTVIDQLNAEIKERDRLEKALSNQLAKNKLVESDLNKELVKSRFELQQKNKAVKEAAVLSSSLATVYQKESIKLNQLRKKYKDVALAQGESSKQAKNLLVQITALDNRLKRVDANVGQFQRSVGNYSKAMKGAMGAARNLAGAMGLLGGAFLVVRVFRDAFNRMRDFDKEMQNMAGILRTTRPELKELEERIIAVSAASIKTSTEVAELATALIVLGKTKDEVLDLLEPVNNLSIALQSTSDETGKFLVQSLNAFQKTSSSAAEFADTIAAIRASTSLDFQRMRDSFQYITPIANVLGKDLAWTGATVGLLADNGLKAEQSGRLLATSLIKLATSGKSLQEALDEINTAYRNGAEGQELLSMAGKDFGKQAAKVAVILATQGDKLELYEKRIRSASGSLDDLVNEQLKSVDAQLKITTATWEEFILSIENGEGAISQALGGALSMLNTVIKGWTLLNKTTEGYNDYLKNDLANETLKTVAAEYKKMGDNAEAEAIKEADRARDKVEAIEKEIKALKERNKALKEDESGFAKGVRRTVQFVSFGTQSTPDGNEYDDNAEKIRQLSADLGYHSGVLKASENVIEQTADAQRRLNGANDDALDLSGKTIAKLRELIKLERDNIEVIDLEVEGNKEIIEEKQDLIAKYQAEIDAILGVNRVRKQGIQAIEGSLASMRNSISLLEEKRDKLATNSEEYKTYTEKINEANGALVRLEDTLKGVKHELAEGISAGATKIDITQEDLDKWEELRKKREEAEAESGKILGLDANGANDGVNAEIQAMIDAERRKREILEETAEYKKELDNEVRDNAVAAFSESINFASTLFDAKIQKYEDDIQANSDYYDALLANENLSEEQRIALEAERDAKEEQIEKKKRAEQKKQAILNKVAGIAEVAINTAIAVSKVTAQAGVAAPLLIPSIIALGALQAATIAAQPIPQYKDGKKQGQGKDGIALLNDGGKDELRISKSGEIERITGRNVLAPVLKSDTIVPDADKFLSSLSDNELYENLHKHSILASISHQKQSLDSYLLAQSMNKAYEKQTNRVVKAIEGNRTKVNVHNNNSIGDDLAFQLALNKL